MKGKLLSLLAAAAIGAGTFAAYPAGNQAHAEGFGFGFYIDLGRTERQAPNQYTDGRYGHSRHGGPAYHEDRRVPPQVVYRQLSRQGYHRIHEIRFHPGPMRHDGRVVRGYYTAEAFRRGRAYRLYLNRAGHTFARQQLRAYGHRDGYRYWR